MATKLVEGLSAQAAAEAVAAAAARELEPGKRLGVWTEVGSKTVLVGIAVPGGMATITIDRAEYDGLKLLGIIDGSAVHEGPQRGAAARG